MDFILIMKCYSSIYVNIKLRLFGLYMIVGHLLDIVHIMNLMDVMDGNLDVKHVNLKNVYPYRNSIELSE